MGAKTIIICCIVLASTLLLLGCNGIKSALEKRKKPEDPVVEEPSLKMATLDTTKELHVNVAEEFIIRVEGNPSTGFSWFYCGKDTVDGVEMKKSDYEPAKKKNSIECGAPVMCRFYFEAKKPGSHELKFEYKRPWEKDEDPMTKSIMVIVEN